MLEIRYLRGSYIWALVYKIKTTSVIYVIYISTTFYITDPVCEIACSSTLIRADVASALYVIVILEAMLCILKYVHIIFIAVMHIYLMYMNSYITLSVTRRM